MKKQLFWAGVMALMSLMPVALFAQSTQGTDFWVTLMRGDEGNYSELSLTFAAKQSTEVYIENAHNAFRDTVTVGNDTIYRYRLNNIASYCYVTDGMEEQPVYRALHVTAEKPISLIAANYKDKSFDVAAILPTTALLSEYRIQCYSPSAHSNNSQGSHFAIVAAEDDVVVDIKPSVYTNKGKVPGETFATDTLMKGQVYYVWTGYGSGSNYDFTGTEIKARDNKKIAVFNGNSHTNIPSNIRDRDHVYSQAMPVNYWGKRFAITSSLTTIDGSSGYWERIDKIRVQALVDGTVVKIDGDTVHTFDFVSGSDEDRKHFYEFDFGAKDSKTNYEGDGHTYFDGTSHFIETSCPCAVHLFMTSDRYDHKSGNYCNGDPSEIWVNPIEQKIDTLTFGTFQTAQVRDHFINIVTTANNVSSVRLDGNDISGKFKPLNGNSEYVFARITGVEDRAHTLTSDSGFIAHVYGFGEKESYGYPAGGRTKDLSAYITINGQEFKPGEENLICGAEKVDFSCELNYDFDSIYWYFGDGTDSTVLQAVSIEHHYEKAGSYDAYVRIFRPFGEADECISWSGNVFDSIAFHVNFGSSKIAWKHTEVPKCILKGEETDIRITLDNPDHVALDGDSVKISFDQKTKDAGFKDDEMRTEGDSVLIVHVPSTAEDRVDYKMDIHIGSECPENVFDTTIIFQMEYDISLLTQRFDHTLGITRDSFPTQTLSNFVWFHDGDTIKGEDEAVLQLDRTNPDNTGEFYVCFDIEEEGKETVHYCTCPVHFDASQSAIDETFEDDANMEISATYVVTGNAVFVNAKWGDKTTFEECYAEWLDVSGRVWQEKQFNLPDGGCLIDVPQAKGFYLLRVTTDGGSRSFKFFINH